MLIQGLFGLYLRSVYGLFRVGLVFIQGLFGVYSRLVWCLLRVCLGVGLGFVDGLFRDGLGFI